MKIAISLLTFLVISNLTFTQPVDSPWPVIGHDKRNTFQSEYVSAQDTSTYWWINVKSRGPIILDHNGVAYTSADSAGVTYSYAISPSGTLKWRLQYGIPRAITNDGTILTRSNGTLKAITPDGQLLWSRTFPLLISTITTDETTIYVTNGYGYVVPDSMFKIFALNLDGSDKWSYTLNATLREYSYGLIASSNNGEVYITTMNGTLISLNAATGSHNWTIPAYFTWNDHGPMVGSDGTIYIAKGSTVTSIRPNGTVKWTHIIGGAYNSPAALAEGKDGIIYTLLTQDNGKFSLLSLNPNGIIRWTVEDIKYTWTYYPRIIVGADNTIYTTGDSLCAFTSTGQLFWTFRKPTYFVATGPEGRLYATTGSNGVRVFKSPKAITLITPNGGENWQVNDTYDITWNSIDVSEVKIDYSTDNGASWLPIISSTPSDGLYTLTIPNTPSTQCKVKISDVTNTSIMDMSDNTFTISEIPINPIEINISPVDGGPDNLNLTVSPNGKAYAYYYLASANNPINYPDVLPIAINRSDGQRFYSDGYFLTAGVFRIAVPYSFINNDYSVFELEDSILIADTLYIIQDTIPSFTVSKIPMKYEKTFDFFLGGSAGLSGTIGTVGAGASIAAAKISIKGTGGMGLKIIIDQDQKILFDRRCETSLGTELKIPSVNPGISGVITINSGYNSQLINRDIIGKSFSFSDINLSEDKKKMAQTGFILETLSLGAATLSPFVGPFIEAVINTLNNLGGVSQTFEDAEVGEYWGLGVEGNIGIETGFQIGFVNFEAASTSLGSAFQHKQINYFRDYPSPTPIKKLREFNYSHQFDLSLLSFGLAFDDGVSLSSNNTKLFDEGLGMETIYGAGFDDNDNLTNLYCSLSGGGELGVIGLSDYTYHSTNVNIQASYIQQLYNAGLGITGLNYQNINIPLDINTVLQTATILQTASNNYNGEPIEVSSKERRGKSLDVNLGIDLDAGLGVGLGFILGINAKYLNEVEFEKKYTEVYLNGKNYLLRSADYSDSMDQFNLTELVNELFSGTVPLIQTAFLNLLNQFNQVVQSGQNFILNAYNQTSNFLGGLVGAIQQTGQLFITTYSPNSPRIYQMPSQEPEIMQIYYSFDVKHKQVTTEGVQLEDVESMMVAVNDALEVSFIPDGQSNSLDSLNSPITLKMLIDEQKLIDYGFQVTDKERVKIYRFDDSLRVWVMEGGILSGDTVITNVSMMSSYVLGIEITDSMDITPPEIYEFGPEQGSIQTTYPEVYAKVRDNMFGVGVDLAHTYIIINEDTVNYSIDPSIDKIYYQLSESDSLVSDSINVKLLVSDYNGNISSFVFDFILDTTSQSFSLTVLVNNGWNMISVPGLNSPDQNVNTWWAYRDPGANVFKYFGGYLSVTDAIPGIGYWMKHSGDRTYNTGEEWPAGGIQIVAHTPLAGASGWNLIGGYENIATTALITTNPPGQQSGPVYKYSGGYSVATTLDPGYGYWIKLLSAAQIIIPETLAKGEKPIEWFPEDWGKIVLTDAAGISYTLYAVKGEVNLDQYELPPAPMAGMFDIRFSSGRIAEDINSSMQTIDMSGVTYPLTVRVEGMDMRLMDETGKTINVNLKSGEDVVISDATINKLMVTGELIPAVYVLEQNYPNPFNPSTVIEFSLPEDVSNVKLSIYNSLGEKVAELINTALVAGKYQYQWNARNVATGIYIYELRAKDFVSVKKMILLK